MKINTLLCFSMVKNEHFNHFFRTMKIGTILLFVCVFQLLATQTDAQNATMRINAKVISIGQLLEEIEQQTDYLIVYRNREVNTNHKVRITSRSAQVKDYLNNAFADTDIDYQFENNYIVLARKNEQSAVSAVISQQSGKKITGTVLDDMGDPVVGANVVEQGTTNGIITDFEGKFTLNVAEDAVLVVSYIGYKQQAVYVAGKTTLEIRLAEDTQALEEVVVVGYGTQKKVNLTGAVSQVDSKVFENRPVTSTANALQGTIAGVQITPGSGAPNTDLEINVRGTTSINGGSPLVLIDGVEGNLRLLNPADIESVSILKDAAAAAVYGVRAAFGVVLITTKRGHAGRLTVNYTGNVGWAKATYMPEFVDNSYDHALFVNQALTNNNAAPLYNAQRMDGIKAKYEDPSLPDYMFVGKQYYQVGYHNWVDELIRKSTLHHTHNFNISGGSDKTTFYASVSYHNQEGYLKINPPIYNRYNTRLSVDNNSYDWLKLGFTVAYNNSNYNSPTTYQNEFWRGLIFSSPLNGGQWEGDPAYPEYDQFIGYYFQDQNQVPVLRDGGRTIQDNHEIVLSPSITITPVKGWNIHANYNHRRNFNKDTYDRKRIDNLINNTANGIVAHADPGNATQSQDYYQINQSQVAYYSFNAYTDYLVSINKHNIKAMLGFNQELTRYDYQSAQRKWMINPDTPSLSLGTGDQSVGQNAYEVALRGAFGRINYDYEGRYLLEIVGRYDGTSRFPKDRRFVFMPSASLGWRLSEESFMNFVKPLFDNIKIRASYGTLGNQMLGGLGLSGNMNYYPYIAALSNGTSAGWLFDNDNMQKTINPPSQLPISSLTWEKVKTANLGLDLDLLNNRLGVGVDVYSRKTSDMLMSLSLPEVLGATAPKMNSGELTTRGWELSMKWRDHIGDFSYSVGFNLLDYQAEITEWESGTGSISDYYVGRKIGEIWGFETEGFITADDFVDGNTNNALKIPQSIIASNWKPGDVKYRDRNNNGALDIGANTPEDSGDRYIIGNSTPRYQYGITGDVQWKGVFLNFFLQGVGKKDFWNGTEEFFPMGTQYYNTQKHWVENSWTPENTDAYFPLTRARSTQNRNTQTKYLQDGSYLRLKNITIGYDLPLRFASKLALSKAQLYVSGENLYEISHLVGPYDPESVYGGNTSGTGSFSYPFERTFSVGLNLTF
ncbi:MAG: TonB-dependent receptor [Tannerella sp.]|jgi:TonB-linked SusC/RagA family outer membrane protein|nr:TonB-dependent receptor [Tannerella sp.]